MSQSALKLGGIFFLIGPIDLERQSCQRDDLILVDFVRLGPSSRAIGDKLFHEIRCRCEFRRKSYRSQQPRVCFAVAYMP